MPSKKNDPALRQGALDQIVRGNNWHAADERDPVEVGPHKGVLYVFPALRGTKGHIGGLSKVWGEVRAKAGMPDLRLHDLRHSFASFAVADGAALYLVGKVLGHKQASTTEIYAHLRDDPLKAVADATARKIAAAMKGDAERE